MRPLFRTVGWGWQIVLWLGMIPMLLGCAGTRLVSGPPPSEHRPDPAVLRSDRPLSIKLNPTPAADLPPHPPDLVGSILRVADNTLLLDSSRVSLSGTDGLEAIPGPTVEVTITRETQVYKLRMDFEQNREIAEPGAVDALLPDLQLQVWGRRTGDRVVAEVLVYVGEGAVRFQSSP